MIKIFFISIGFLLQFISIGQNQNTPKPIDVKQINAEARSKIYQFKNFLEKLATTRNKEYKSTYKKSISSLFEDNATIEVMNLDKKKKVFSLSKYLNDIVPFYTERFEIVFFNVKIVSINSNNLQPIKNPAGEIIKYKGTFKFIQGFCVKIKRPENSEGFDYSDPKNFDVCEETEKTGEFFLEKEYQRIVGSVWVLKLGDIKAEHIFDKKTIR